MNRFILFVGTVLLALAMSGAWAQPGKGNGRGGRDADARQDRSERRDDALRRGRDLSPEERERLRRDIREYGRDVYRDRDRDREANRDRDRGPRRTERERPRR